MTQIVTAAKKAMKTRRPESNLPAAAMFGTFKNDLNLSMRALLGCHARFRGVVTTDRKMELELSLLQAPLKGGTGRI
jgi:hypothetical protein